MAELLLLLFGIAFATIGGTGYAIFGPLTVRHLMDRGLADEVEGSSLSRAGLAWILAGRYRRHDDANLRRLALPARIMLALLLAGLLLFAAWWLLAQA
ncbi:MAG: hypothetical protein U0S76_06110 [Pseudoxanthomonas sp.]|nr:hypothetical protein [Pseudoxanthomonas sp.]